MWHKGKYLGHPHLIAQVYLDQWGALWGQQDYPEHQVLWGKMRSIIQGLKDQDTRLDHITVDRNRRAIYKLNRRTAVGVDQWSPAMWRGLSDEAMEELVKLLNEVE